LSHPRHRHLALLLATTLLGSTGCEAPAFELPDDSRTDGKADGTSREAYVIDAITAWNADISSDDRQAKYCKMAASPFVFYRGTNHLFWADLAYHPRLGDFGNEKTRTWIGGDQHIENFGAFDNDRGVVVFSLNDFDDAVIADYQYDLWRTAISIVLAAEEHGVLPPADQAEVIDAMADAYLDAMARYRGTDDELDRIFSVDTTSGVLREFLEHVEETRGRDRMLRSWTTVVDGERVLDVSRDNLVPVTEDEEEEILAAMAAYEASLSGGGRRFDDDYLRVKSIARRLYAGTGSLGSDRFYLLIEGASDADDDDRILDVKQQDAPTPYHFFDDADREAYDQSFEHHAQRHARAYKGLERHTDDHLGWMILGGETFSVRERSAYKRDFPIDSLRDIDGYLELADYWGEILATGHARADKDFDDELVPYSVDKQIDEAVGGARDEFKELLREVAFSYADRVDRDWQSFLGALAPARCP
jgi:uncharacterized protein (DUF2252 family)